MLADNGDVALAQVNDGKVKISVVNILRDTKEGAWITGLDDNNVRIIVSGKDLLNKVKKLTFWMGKWV